MEIINFTLPINNEEETKILEYLKKFRSYYIKYLFSVLSLALTTAFGVLIIINFKSDTSFILNLLFIVVFLMCIHLINNIRLSIHIGIELSKAFKNTSSFKATKVFDVLEHYGDSTISVIIDKDENEMGYALFDTNRLPTLIIDSSIEDKCKLYNYNNVVIALKED